MTAFGYALHTPAQTTIRFSTDVSMASTSWLVGEVAHARDYLRHRTVVVELDSSGGSADGLEYWLLHCRRWMRDPGFTLATRAVGAAESAAALMLSHGTVGHRSALPTARLLFHTGRIVTAGQSVWTAQQLKRHHERMYAFDRTVLERLADHVLLGLTGADDTLTETMRADDRDELLERYADLWHRDEHIKPSEAKTLGLIDLIESE